MKKVTISEFRPHLHAILRGVERTKRPVLVTRFGKPFIEIKPIASQNLVSSGKSKMRILGDIILPASDSEDHDTLCER